MKMLHSTDLPKLLTSQPGPCVSMYIDTQANRDPRTLKTRWKGLLNEADSLIRRSFSGHRARFLLEPMKTVPEILAKANSGAAIAFFRSFTTAGYYPVKDRVSELAVVSDTFHLKPLLRVIQEHDNYFALALSQRKISLYRGNRQGATLLASYHADYGDSDSKKKWSIKSERIAVPRGKAARDNEFHFRPVDRVSRFIELTEPYIWTRLHRESSPLILVGTPFMHALYRNMNCYPYLSTNGVLASVPHETETIHKRAWPIAERSILRTEIQLSERYFEEKQKNNASEDLHEIAKASLQGRVSSLMVSKGTQEFGLLNRDSGEVKLRGSCSQEIGDDVLDDIAQEVILRKGQAFVLPQEAMPTPAPIAAVYRW
jgi:hypothetical protein